MPNSGPSRTASLTVAVTGPTGDIGRSLLRALDRSRDVKTVNAMARKPFDPAAAGLRKTIYRQGDVLDRDSVDRLVQDADVVVHLAFLILGGLDETERINIEGSRNVFEATVAAGPSGSCTHRRSPPTAFTPTIPQRLTEDVPPRGTDRHYYSAQKAKLEGALNEITTERHRPPTCSGRASSPGPTRWLLLENIPYIQLSDRCPAR